jgi:hypothetical protein
MLDDHLQLTIHLQLSIHLHAVRPSGWRDKFLCIWWVLILELAAGDDEVFWGLRKRWVT